MTYATALRLILLGDIDRTYLAAGWPVPHAVQLALTEAREQADAEDHGWHPPKQRSAP